MGHQFHFLSGVWSTLACRQHLACTVEAINSLSLDACEVNRLVKRLDDAIISDDYNQLVRNHHSHGIHTLGEVCT